MHPAFFAGPVRDPAWQHCAVWTSCVWLWKEEKRFRDAEESLPEDMSRVKQKKITGKTDRGAVGLYGLGHLSLILRHYPELF